MNRPSNPFRLFIVWATPVILVSLVLASGQSMLRRLDLLDYWLFIGIGILASIPPHILLPDPRQSQNQLANLRPALLQQQQWNGMRPLMWGLTPAPLIIAFMPPLLDGADLLAFLSRAGAYYLVLFGIGMYSFSYYYQLGSRSQEWHEAKRGGAYRWLKTETPIQLAMPEGLVPAFLATGRIGTVGLLTMLAVLFLHSQSIWLGLAPGFILLAGSFFQYRKHSKRFDVAYYHSNAFFREVFSGGRLRARALLRLPFAGTYWVPNRWRPAVWMSLTQLDRRLPLGRLMALGHVLLWFLFMRGVDLLVIGAFLALLMLAQKCAVLVVMQPKLSPVRFTRSLMPEAGWFWVRSFVNLRWSLAMILSLLTVALFSERFTFLDVALWTLADIALSFIVAALFSLRAARQDSLRYA